MLDQYVQAWIPTTVSSMGVGARCLPTTTCLIAVLHASLCNRTQSASDVRRDGCLVRMSSKAHGSIISNARNDYCIEKEGVPGTRMRPVLANHSKSLLSPSAPMLLTQAQSQGCPVFLKKNTPNSGNSKPPMRVRLCVWYGHQPYTPCFSCSNAEHNKNL
jgi:hypothetical protein